MVFVLSLHIMIFKIITSLDGIHFIILFYHFYFITSSDGIHFITSFL
jgi:hypothetical protein